MDFLLQKYHGKYKIHFGQSISELTKEGTSDKSHLKVNVGLPHVLRHVKTWLAYGQLIDAPCPLSVIQHGLQCRKLDPHLAIFGVKLCPLLIQLPTAVKLTKLDLQVYVASEQFVFWAHADCLTLSEGWKEKGKVRDIHKTVTHANKKIRKNISSQTQQ